MLMVIPILTHTGEKPHKDKDPEPSYWYGYLAADEDADGDGERSHTYEISQSSNLRPSFVLSSVGAKNNSEP